MFIAATVLIIAGALSLRFASVPDSQQQVPKSGTPTVTEGLPAFTSASFETGDALGSLGPEWTFVRQNEVQGKTASTLSGTTPTRETLVRLIGATTVMLITEFNVTDVKALKKAVAAKTVQPLTIAERSGFLVPVPSLNGGSAFLLTGTSTALMLEYGEDQNGVLTKWPNDVPKAIQYYISAVKVY